MGTIPASGAPPCLILQACDAWQRAAREAKERALAADSARQLALQKKEEVEAQFQQLQKELECRGLVASLPELRGCGDMGDIPLPQLHSLQSQLRLDLEAVDGVSPAPLDTSTHGAFFTQPMLGPTVLSPSGILCHEWSFPGSCCFLGEVRSWNPFPHPFPSRALCRA